MNIIKYTKLVGSGIFILCSSLLAQATVATDPVGFVNVELKPGNGTQKSTNVISLPLHPLQEDIEGLSVGVINEVTSNSIQVLNAGWSNGSLSNLATPYLFKISSGNAEGLILPISTTNLNTSDRLYLNVNFGGEGIDLTSLGITTGINGDKFEIIPCDTLSSLFGTPETTGIIGGTNALNADTIIVFSLSWDVYFYSTNTESWVKSTFGFPNADNLVLHPDFAIIYERISPEPLYLTLVGSVPTEQKNVAVKNSGITFLVSGWPVDTTLGQAGIEQLSGWQSGTNASTADSVIIRSDLGIWETFFYDGAEWKKSIFGFPTADSQPLITASGLIINRLGSNLGLSQLTQPVPYLNNL